MKVSADRLAEIRARAEAAVEFRGLNNTHAILGEDVLWLLAEIERLREERERAIYLAQHLLAMVPREVWRDSGGDDGQGHYEGDYRAEQVASELAALAGGGEAA